ncbi:MAG: helix-turn-helix domain-containing protein, partial [Candidatus Syntrophosphaera sp.]
LYVIIGLALILCVWVILKFFRKRKPAEFPDRFVQTPTGSILLLDDDPRIRMVKKLHDQGWDASQIARELKLSVQQVEEITSKEEETGEDDA